MKQVLQRPRKRALTPDPDGIITDFSFPETYKAGTVSVWVNGQKKDPDLDDGYLELGGAVVQLKEPPLAGDLLWGEYDPT